MEDDVVRKVVELIFHEQVINTAAMTAPDSSIPACLLTRDFSRSMQVVLITKQIILHYRWKKFVDTCYKNMFNSHEMYLRYIMFACQTEHNFHKEIFESFISVWAVLINLSSEAYMKTDMDFRGLNLDIFMVFYRTAMKKRFRNDGGFQKLVKYVRGHRYLEWNNTDDPKCINAYKSLKILEERVQYHIYELIVCSDDVEKDATSSILAKKFLSTTSVRFPTLLSKDELVQNLVAFRRNEKTENTDLTREIVTALVSNLFEVEEDNRNSTSESKTNRNSISDSKTNRNSISDSKTNRNLTPDSKTCRNSTPDSKTCRNSTPDSKTCRNSTPDSKTYGNSTPDSKTYGNSTPDSKTCRNSTSDSKTNHTAEEKEDVTKCEDIIKAVIRYNQSVSSGHEQSNNRLQKDAYEILEHLKDNIQSFIELLDEYDEE